MRITKIMAENIAKMETRKKFDPLFKAANDLLATVCEEEVLKIAAKDIPQDLIDRGFVRSTTQVKFRVMRSDREYYEDKTYQIRGTYPVTCYRDSHHIDTTEKVLAAYDAKKKLDEESKKFLRDLERIIGSFTTHNALLKHLPELQPHFKDADVGKSMALIPVEQINKMRAQLTA